MNPHDIKTLLAINKHIHSIQDYCSNCKELKEFERNSMLVEACVFNLMQIGELAKSELSEECKQNLKTIPWNQLYGMRNRIVHGYSGVKLRIVWDTITDDLPLLEHEISVILEKLK